MDSARDSSPPYATMGFAPYLPALKAFISRNIRDQSMVDDLVQEVILRLHTRRSASPIDNLEGYLFRIASSVMADNARRSKARHVSVHEELSESDHPVEEISPDRVLIARQQMTLVVAALEELPERTRDIFLLRRFEQLSYAEIAGRYNISVSAVEKHVAKAMQHILRVRA